MLCPAAVAISIHLSAGLGEAAVSGPSSHKVDPTASTPTGTAPSGPSERAESGLGSSSSRHQPTSAHTSFWDLKLQELKAMRQHGGVSNSSKSHSGVILPMDLMKCLPFERKKVRDNTLCISAASSPATPAHTGPAAKDGMQEGI